MSVCRMRGVCAVLCFALVVALQAQHGHRAQVYGHPWVTENCRRLSTLLRHKHAAVRKLGSAALVLERDGSLAPNEKLFRIHTLEVFQRELNESERSLFQAVEGLQRVLTGNLRDIVNMRDSSRQRLQALREAAIKEEQEYMELVAAEKHQQEALKMAQDRNKTLSMLEEILEDVRKAADRLEEDIEEHAFDNNKQMKGVNVEAVLRVEEDEEDGKRKNASMRVEEGNLGLGMLIDSQNNQYVLTKPRDSTMSRADHHFIKDLVLVVMLSLPCGWLCALMGLPPMFGYIICGVLLGPSGLNSIKSIVQVETLGELGVFFTLFVVGLEFSPERLHKVWRISLQGSGGLSLLMVSAGLLWGKMLHLQPSQTIFISCCLSLSSTPLVSRFLAGGSRAESKEGELDYSSVLLGMLVMQDVQLGLFIAVMPTFIQGGTGDTDSVLMGALHVLVLLARVLVSLAGVLMMCWILRSHLIGPFYRKLHAESKGNKEILVLGTSAFVFLMLTVTEFMDVSMELGCFLAGALLSSQGHMVTTEVMSCAEPIRDFLAIIFFASIGLHVFPTFVLYELTILLVLTFSLVIMKFLMAVLVLSAALPPGSRHMRWLVSAGLAQVSEFSFVLGSRARRAGIISREVYLLVLSVTTLSLLLAPVLWRAATIRCIPRPDTYHSPETLRRHSRQTNASY
ncbi:transmembrane and coiled-coil domain-containing protein 3 [Pimephales promelas]|uniref:transmembrane and coiled-coil domain-containing protein 3 n=1 Tax=Pimephales promelas TaxID=90988 RepID=UPI001955B935|nr:transmembrane and coiled-coil domain-containing protein 3 [Pimephales promelas]XP_039502920.1 transmembrane and coiled-coil domain-containing protein 3 [Pimephales promelas]